MQLFCDPRQLQLIFEEKTKGIVFNLNAFHGKLIACISNRIVLYTLMESVDGSALLMKNCIHRGQMHALQVQTCGEIILVSDSERSIYLLKYKNDKGFEEIAYDDSENRMTSTIQTLDVDLYLGEYTNFNLFTLRENNEEGVELDVEGEYHVGEFFNRFRHGSLAMNVLSTKI